jgi:hypothetical protein
MQGMVTKIIHGFFPCLWLLHVDVSMHVVWSACCFALPVELRPNAGTLQGFLYVLNGNVTVFKRQNMSWAGPSNVEGETFPAGAA